MRLPVNRFKAGEARLPDTKIRGHSSRKFARIHMPKEIGIVHLCF